MFRIHSSYVFFQSSGTKRVSPASVAATAFSASGATFTNHWRETSGSTIVSHRWQRARGMTWLFSPRRRPSGVEVPEDLLPRLEAVETGVGGPRGRGHLSVEADHGDRLERIALPRLEVVRVVRGRDLHDARAELPVHEGIGDHAESSRPVSGQRHAPPDEPRVPLVVGMHGERRVAEHRLRPRRRDDELAPPSPTSGYAIE